MRIVETRTYRGPSPYGSRPVIRLTVATDAHDGHTTADFPGFADALLDMLPALGNAHLVACEPDEWTRPPDFRLELEQQLRGDAPLPDVLPHIALALQLLAGTPVTFGSSQPVGRGRHRVIYEYQEEQVGTQAGHLAVAVVNAALSKHFGAADRQFDLDRELIRLARLADQVALDPGTAAIVAVARQRRIPDIRLNDLNLVQLGYGRYQKRIEGTFTSRTAHIAVDIATDPELTLELLFNAGVPVPSYEVVESADVAIAAAERLGYPVMTKPLVASRGRGVSRHLETAAQVRTGYEHAHTWHERVVVEQCIAGRDYRVLVVNDEVVAVAEHAPAHVVGNGHYTIRELVSRVNRDPRRGVGHEKVLNQIEIDAQAERLLQQAGYTWDTVLEDGQVCYLRSAADIAAGGTAVDRTTEIHHDNASLARRAANVVGLDIAGVEIVTPDIARPMGEVGGAVVEVIAAPDFRMHGAPTDGSPRDVASPVVDMLFPPGEPARIPIVAITGTNGKTTTARMVAHILKMSGDHVGLTTSDGIYVDGEQHLRGDMTGLWSAQVVLKDPTVDAAVLETGVLSIVEEGLGFDFCDVGAVLNVANDHLGARVGGLESLDDIAQAKSVVVDVVPPSGHAILNADDPRCLSMARDVQASVVLFSTTYRNAAVRVHLDRGGTAVVLEEGVNGDMIMLYEGQRQVPVLWTHLIPATFERLAPFNVANAVAATAISHALGVSIANIRQGLRTFATTFFQTPGRLNVFDQYAFRVLVDSAHNPSAYRALADVVSALPAERRVGVIGAPGDRRDADIRTMGEIAAQVFDRLIIKESRPVPGRQPGAVAGLLRSGARSVGFPDDAIDVVLPEEGAVDLALRRGQDNDLVVIVADDATTVWKHVIYFGRAGVPRRPVSELEVVQGGETRRIIGPRPGPPHVSPDGGSSR